MSAITSKATKTAKASRSAKATKASKGTKTPSSMQALWGQLRPDPDPDPRPDPDPDPDPGPGAGLTEGSFVVGDGPEVFWVIGGLRRHVPDGTTLLAIASSGWQSVVRVSQAALDSAPAGAPLPSREDGKVYRAANAPEVYVIESLMRHHIPDAETLEANFGGWNAVVLIEQSDCDAIPLGSSIPSVTLDDGTIEGYFRSLPDITVDPVQETHTPAGSSPLDVGGITFDIMKEHATIRRQTPSPLTLSPALDVLYPGSLLQGASLSTGQLAPLAGGLPRTGGVLTCSTDVNAAGPPRTSSVAIDKATQAIVTDARHNLIYSLNPQGGAAVADFSQIQARTAEHGLVKLGVSFTSSAFSAEANASLDTDIKISTVMVMLTQVFYSMTFTPPDGPNQFFADTVTVDAVKQVCSATNPPCYLSQVDYGRTLVMTITGTDSTTKLAAALTAGMKSTAIEGHVSVSAEQQKTLSESTVQVVGRGGQDKLVMQLVADPMVELPKYLEAGGEFTPTNPGVPLRYIARHAGSKRIVTINLSAAYDESVAGIGRDVSQTFQVWDGPGGGTINTDVKVGKQDILSISADGSNLSGIIFDKPYGPDGWYRYKAANDYPLPGQNPYGLCGRWNTSNQGPDGLWFWVGRGFTGAPPNLPAGASTATLYLGTNDNWPTNGDPKYKFTVHVQVRRDNSGFASMHRA